MTLPGTIAILRSGSESNQPVTLTPEQCGKVTEALDLGLELARAALNACAEYRDPKRPIWGDAVMQSALNEVRSIAQRRFAATEMIPFKITESPND